MKAYRQLNHLLTVLLLVGGACASLGAADIKELGLDPKLMAKMDDWEKRQLIKAMDIFYGRDKKAAKSKKRWALSAAAFNGFIEEFPRSNAVAYSLYMQARSHHHDNKLNKARTNYDDIIQFFPNDVIFAAAALYHKGASYEQQSDEELAMKTWALIAKDPEYRRQPIAAGAIVKLADYEWKKGKYKNAAKFFRDIAIDFYHTNNAAAKRATERFLEYHIKVDMSEQKLREFYKENKGWFRRHKKVGSIDEISASQDYWNEILRRIEWFGRFEATQVDQKRKYYGYWAAQTADKNMAWDDFRFKHANFQLAADGNRKGWFVLLDKQFAEHQKDGDNWRIIKWMKWYQFSKTKIKEYYAKLQFDRMDFRQTFEVMKLLYDKIGAAEAGQLVAGKFKLDKMKDNELAELGRYMYRKDKDFALRIIKAMASDDEMNWTMLNLVGNDKEVPLEDRVAYADKLQKSEKYAEDAIWKKGQIYEAEKKYQAAIPCYLGAPGRQSEMAFAVARCYMLDGKVDQALGQLMTGENMFKAQAHQFAWVTQEYQQKAGRKDQMLATLRRISHQYKGTASHSKAHVKLEKLGVGATGAEGLDE